MEPSQNKAKTVRKTKRSTEQKTKAEPVVLNKIEPQSGYVFDRVTVPDLDAAMPGWKEHNSIAEARFVYNYLRSNDAQAAINSVFKSERKPSPQSMLMKPNIRRLIATASRNMAGAKLSELSLKLTNTLWQRAFYDPAVFCNTDGSPKFRTWEEIPESLRCVVDGIETKLYGKNNIPQTTIKLAPRVESLKMVMDIAEKSIIVGSDNERRLEHSDLALLFDEESDNFEQANKKLLGIPEEGEEVIKPEVVEETVPIVEKDSERDNGAAPVPSVGVVNTPKRPPTPAELKAITNAVLEGLA